MEQYIFDYRKLNGRIHETLGSHRAFAKAMDLSDTTISKKLSSKSFFTQEEIEKAVNVLGIDRGMITTYFFTR